MIENGYMPVFGPNLESAFEFLVPEPESESESVPIPDPESTPEPDPAPEPEDPPAPLEVVTVDDLLDRLAGTGEDSTEELPGELEPEGEVPSETPLEVPAMEGLSNAGEAVRIIGMDTVLQQLETIQQAVDHPALTTPFEDYTVTEGLLLLLFLSVFVTACVKMLKGGFAWLR